MMGGLEIGRHFLEYGGTLRVAHDPDHLLVSQTLQGDLSAFDVLVGKYQRPVYALCLGFVRHPEDARDLAQEVFLKAFMGLKRFRRHSSFRTWLYRIAVNACLSFKSKHREFVALSAEAEPSYTTVDALEQAENRRLVYDLAAQLPRSQRTALLLRIEQGLSYEEISEITGQSVSNLKTTVFYALRKIKQRVRKSAGVPLGRLQQVESS